jgi:hypothetical protein
MEVGMADPLTLTVLGTIAATEGIKFLYGQAAELLKGYRERRKAAKAAEEVPPKLEVPLRASEILDGIPAPTPADTRVVADNETEMVKLVATLSPYATDIADVPVDDPELAAQAGRLRQLLEAAYGQRLTFKGEDRDATGTRVTVRQVLDKAEGAVLGIRSVTGSADARVDQDIKHLGEKATLTGVDEVRGGSTQPPAKAP